jgi:hypothetical protein
VTSGDLHRRKQGESGSAARQGNAQNGVATRGAAVLRTEAATRRSDTGGQTARTVGAFMARELRVAVPPRPGGGVTACGTRW